MSYNILLINDFGPSALRLLRRTGVVDDDDTAAAAADIFFLYLKIFPFMK